MAAVAAGGVDVVLMDLHMPDMDCIAATRAIRALDGPAAAVAIVAATAGAMEHEVRRCLEAGMDAAVAKPIDPRALFRTLARVLGPLGAEPDAADADDPTALLEAGEAAFEPAVYDALAEQLGAEFAMELVAAFEAAAYEALAALADARAAGDAAAMAHAAHGLKSAAGSIGLRAAWRGARRLEDAAGAGHIDEASAGCESLPDAVEQGLAALRAHTRRTAAE